MNTEQTNASNESNPSNVPDSEETNAATSDANAQTSDNASAEATAPSNDDADANAAEPDTDANASAAATADANAQTSDSTSAEAAATANDDADDTSAEPAADANAQSSDDASGEANATAAADSEPSEDDKKKLLCHMMVQTGTAKSGASNLIDKMEPEEVDNLLSATKVEKGAIRIHDSAAWNKAHNAVASRLNAEHKASVEGAEADAESKAKQTDSD